MICEIIVVYLLINAVSTLLVAGFFSSFNYTFGDVFDMYIIHRLHRKTTMNWFGCLCTTLVLHFISLYIGIPCLIYWLFHVGRKN